MRFGSLFSGVGGADMGLVASGMTPVWACEIDKKARAVYRRHFPGVPIYHDVKEMKGHALQPVDVLFFGSPCQDLSVAGKRAGLSGARSGLFFEAMRVCDEMAAPPRIVVWENVRGALSSNDGRDFGAVLAEVGKRWSGVAYRVLDLQYFGPPQRRSRVFVVGHSGGWQRAAEILFEPEGVRWNPPARRKAGQGPAGNAPGGSHWSGGPHPALNQSHNTGGVGQSNQELFSQQGAYLVPALAFGGNNCSGPIDVATARTAHAGPHGRLDFESETFCVTRDVAPCLGANYGKQPDSSDSALGPMLIPVAFDTTQITSAANYSNPKPGDACHPLAASAHAPAIAFPANLSGTQCASAEDVFPSMGAQNPTAVALSFRGREGEVRAESLRSNCGGGGKQHVLTAMQVRRLTPVECHRLMGWPDDWCAWGVDDEGKRVEMADGPQYKMIGNGVGKPHAEWIGKRVMAAHHGKDA